MRDLRRNLVALNFRLLSNHRISQASLTSREFHENHGADTVECNNIFVNFDIDRGKYETWYRVYGGGGGRKKGRGCYIVLCNFYGGYK